MKNTIKYKGFVGTIGIAEGDHSMGGRLLNTGNDYVTYVGRDYDEMLEDFRAAVDDYIEFKKNEKNEIEEQCKGDFNVRVKPQLHKDAILYAKGHETSLNKLVEQSLMEKIHA